MHPQLQAIASEFAAALERLNALARALPDAAWLQRPQTGGWSPLECVAHLNLTSRAFIPLLRAATTAARANGRPGPARYRRDPMGWLIATIVSPRPWLKAKTPPTFVPVIQDTPAAAIEEFRTLQTDQLAIVREADGLPIDRLMIVSPFDVRARYSAYSALTILPRHQQRHLAQAERAAAGRST